MDGEPRIVGRVRNLTGTDLRDCALLIGGRVLSLGSLAAGEAVTIERSLDELRVVIDHPKHPGFDPGFEPLFPRPPGGQPDPYYRERILLSDMRGTHYHSGGWDRDVEFHAEMAVTKVSVTTNKISGYLGDIRFIGWSDAPLDLFELPDEERVQAYGLTLYRQRLALELPTTGPVYLSSGFVPFEVVGGEGNWDAGPSGLFLYDGGVELRFVLDLPGVAGFRLQAVTIPEAWSEVGVEVSLYHPGEDRWQTLPTGTRQLTAGELAPFLTAADELTIRLETLRHRGGYPVQVYGLGMEGVLE